MLPFCEVILLYYIFIYFSNICMTFLKIKEKKGFTLVELLVVITLIAILAVWVSNIDYNRLSGKQKLDIFWNQIVSNIETTLNNALLWKWIWDELITPKKWKIEISNSNSWALETFYSSWSSWIHYGLASLNIQNFYSINNIECIKLDWTTTPIPTSTWTIMVEQANLALSGCTDDTYKILRFEWTFLDNKKTIEVNTLNWIVKQLR